MRRTVSLIALLLIAGGVCFAHPGRTDAQGGHHHRKTGTYHFHNKGSSSTQPSTAESKPPQTQHKERLTGVVKRVKDGDTVVLKSSDGTEYNIRLYGIDAPELAQKFGKESKQRLVELVDGKEVNMVVTDTDRYQRKVCVIFLSDHEKSVNETMVAEGFAWWYATYAPKSAALKSAESKARIAKRGLWKRSNPLPPWDYRK